MSGNGEKSNQNPSPLEVAQEQQKIKEEESDPLYGWKRLPMGQPVSLEHLHAGLLSISQIAEEALANNVRTDFDVRQITEQVVVLNKWVVNSRKDIQKLRDDVCEITELVRLIPAIKSLLADIMDKLPVISVLFSDLFFVYEIAHLFGNF